MIANRTTREHKSLEPLNTNAEDNGAEVEENQPNSKRTKIWRRADTTSFLIVLVGFPILVLAATLLTLVWHESMKSVNGEAELNIY